MDKYLAAIRTKPFILLAGISGTGKSRLVRQLARGCCPEKDASGNVHPLYNERKPGNFEMIQVRPNWHDSTQLLGYESRVSGKAEFVVKPFVRFLAKAWLYEEEGIPFFLCLDEMNLAPVEQYFAEYLSVIETRKTVSGKIVTDPLVTFPNEALLREAFKDIYQGVEHEQAERFIRKFIDEGGIAIPQNFVVMGTVNMDETTFSFSRKVLDRAMSFELNEVDMDGGLADDPDCPCGSIDPVAAKCEFTQGFEVYAAAKDDCDKIKDFLVEVNKILDKTPFKIAYRTRNEIMIYCYERTKDGVSLAKALDEATSMKILSRVEGDKRRLVVRDAELKDYDGKGLLESLREVIQKGLKKVRGGEGDYTESDVCARKLDEMAGQLENGYTSFWTR
jgi:5-methylcytosine-specific restriction endonuclease McrBC GTP-binding regulatory subunit McrB